MNKKKRVLFFSHQADFVYGGEVCTLSLMRGLRSNVDVFFCSPAGKYFQLAKDITNNHFVVPSSEFSLKKGKFYFLICYFKTHFRLLEMMHKHEIDVLHATNIRAMIYAWCIGMFTGYRVIWHHHNIIPYSFLRKIYYKMLSMGANIIIVPSEATRNALLKFNLNPNKILTIYNGLETTKFQTHLLHHQDPLRLVFVGQICHRKGLDVIVDIIKGLSRYPIKVQFHIIGDTVDEFEFKDKILNELSPFINSGYVIYEGYREDVAALLQKMDLLLVPSRFDPLPTVIIEAALSGLPSIGNPIDGIPELIINNQTGYLCATPNEYVDKIIELYSDTNKLRKFGKNARNNAEKVFSLSKMVTTMTEKYELLYQDKNF